MIRRNAEETTSSLLFPRDFATSESLQSRLRKLREFESRATILGHIQRGGSPSLRDRVVVSKMGYAAVELLKDGIGNRVIALKNCAIVNYDIFEALNMPKTFDKDTYFLADLISS